MRAYQATTSMPTAVANIYQQQYQMGLFIRAHYPGATVVVNDIGAASFLGENSRILDLVGLADKETAQAVLSNTRDARFVEERMRKENIEFAMLYDGWFPNMLPPEWRKVEQWRIPNVVAAAFDTVTFYAPDRLRQERLATNLRMFSPSLPLEVSEHAF
jgi:hypothetical protein